MNIIKKAKIPSETSFYFKIEITVYFVLIKLQKLDIATSYIEDTIGCPA